MSTRKIGLALISFSVLLTAFLGNLSAQEDPEETDIVVTGAKRKQQLKDTTVPIEVINRDDLEKQGSQNLADALENVPGLEVRPAAPGERGEVLRVQGLDPRHVLILVNGNRITGRFSDAVDLTRIKVEEIERIEIVKGSASALYGSDAIAGVINIITREPQPGLRGEFNAQYGSGREIHFGSGAESNVSSAVSYKNDFIASSVFAGWHKSDGWDLTPDASRGAESDKFKSLSPYYDKTPKSISDRDKKLAFALHRLDLLPTVGESTTGNAFSDMNVGGNFSLFPTDSLTIHSLTTYRYLEQTGVDASETGAIFDRRSQTHDAMIGVGPEIKIGNDALLNIYYNYSRFFDHFTNDQRKSDVSDVRDVTDDEVSELRTQMDWQIHSSHVVTFGAEGLIEELSSPRINKDCKRNFPYECLNEKMNLPPVSVNGDAERTRTSFFAQDEWTLMDAPYVSLVPGIRYEDDSQFGSETMPRLALRIDPVKKLILRASYGEGYRAPSFKDLYFDFQNPGVGYQVVGNEDLKPERSQSFNAGVEWEATKWLWLSTNFFFNNIRNLIDYKKAPSISGLELTSYQASNYKQATTQGVESAISIKALKRWTFDLGYTYTETQDLDSGLPLEGRPIHRGNVKISYDNERFQAGFQISASIFGEQAVYCEKTPFWCTQIEGYPNLQLVAFDREQFLLKYFTPRTISICDYMDISRCSTNPTNGVIMRNPYTLLNLRVYKKVFGSYELYAGVDNALDSYHIEYNLIRPRFIYVGLRTKFSQGVLTPKKINQIRESDGFKEFKESGDYKEYQNSEDYRSLREKREAEDYENYRKKKKEEDKKNEN